MFWVQIGISFLIWIAGGVLLARRPNPAAKIAEGSSRIARIFVAAALMAGCLAVLFLPLNYIASKGGLNGGPMSFPAWIGVTLVGSTFVVANAISMAILVTVAREAAVTERSLITSTKQDPEP